MYPPLGSCPHPVQQWGSAPCWWFPCSVPVPQLWHCLAHLRGSPVPSTPGSPHNQRCLMMYKHPSSLARGWDRCGAPGVSRQDSVSAALRGDSTYDDCPAPCHCVPTPLLLRNRHYSPPFIRFASGEHKLRHSGWRDSCPSHSVLGMSMGGHWVLPSSCEWLSLMVPKS